MVVVPRLLTKLVKVEAMPVGHRVWQDEELLLADSMPQHWHNIFTEERINASARDQKLLLSDILSTFPLALLIGI